MDNNFDVVTVHSNSILSKGQGNRIDSSKQKQILVDTSSQKT